MASSGNRLDEHTVQFVCLLPGPIERVWGHLADGEKRGEWFARGPLPKTAGEPFDMYLKHETLSPNRAPPPPGYEALDQAGHHSHNVLLACEPPHRLVIALGPEAYEASEIEFELAREGDPRDREVRLTLTHRKIPNQPYAVEVSRGWHSYLTMLEHKLNGQNPPAFWDVFRQTEGFYERRYADAR